MKNNLYEDIEIICINLYEDNEKNDKFYRY